MASLQRQTSISVQTIQQRTFADLPLFAACDVLNAVGDSIVEVAGVTFSDSDSAPVPKFLNLGPDPGPAIFQI